MFNVVNIIPTGVGANLGGFAGDANPINSVLETLCDFVITHPNAVNAASLYPATKKTLYVEGYALDLFLKGELGLKNTYNKIGIIIDKKVEHNLTNIINAINACKAVFGVDIVGYAITEELIGAKVLQIDNKLYDGEIKNPDTILQSANKLISQGANALAIFAYLENPYDNADSDYLSGNGVDPIGRLEAIISHFVVENTFLPSAHAPILDNYERTIVDPRVAAEEIGFTYIPCVLKGLQFAPQFVDLKKETLLTDCFTYKNVNAVLAPYSCMQGAWVQPCLEKNIPIIAIKENTTALEDTPEKLGLGNIIVVENYLEAIGVISAIKANINYKTLRRPLSKVPEIK